MEIQTISTDNITKIKVVGRVDTLTSPDFQAQVEKLLQENPQNLEIDCSELVFLSSAGLRAFFVLMKKAKAVGAEITLMSLTTTVREVFAVSGFDQFLNIVE